MSQRIIIPTNINPRPERFEIEAASIVAEYFGADATFIVRDTNRTPDCEIDGVEWEIKSPLGRGKHVIEDQIKRASKQSLYIVIDVRRCKLHIAKIRSQMKYNVELRKHLKRVLLINKHEMIEVIK
ncbi:MAG: hypothetical protein WBB39_01040 [Candidatus Saccharimonadales bacterium]